MGLDINAPDKKKSTPLHWAAFSGSEVALSFILAWNPDVDATDAEGSTPLILATKHAEELKSTRSIKHLLIRGANRHI
jgi:ankyrin repeat protein